jgi:putative CocE/NonD family hydrolase
MHEAPPHDDAIAVTLPTAPNGGMIVQKNVMVQMRDGVRLATDLYRPAGPGPFPTVLVRTPYGSETQEFVTRGQFYVKHGYVFAVQDTRGKYDSEGDWYGKRDEAQDGSDAVTWLGTRPWSNGKVGMIGPSYMGMVQYLVADQENPYLKALVPIVAPTTLGRDTADFDQLAVYSGRESFRTNLTWMLTTDGRVNQTDPPEAIRAARRHLPLADYPKVIGREMPWWPAMLDQRYGLWEQYFLRAARGQWTGHLADEASWWGGYRERYRKVRVPMLHISGWFDCCDEQLIKTFQLVRELATEPAAREHQHLLLGPWTHGVGNRKEGDLDFGPQAAFDPDTAAVRWFDHWLKGEDNGVDRLPTVRAFVMGENRWREAKDWPIPGTEFTKFYLRSAGDARLAGGSSGGGLSREMPQGVPADHYRYDPANPTPEILSADSAWVPGPLDRSAIERREDVLVYSTDPLDGPVEVTGPLKVVLYVSTSAPSTDVLARVVDVWPDGHAYPVFATYGATPYRTHWSKQVETSANGTKIIKAEIMLPPTSIVFAKGHRIRLEIASAAAPTFFGLNVDPATELTATKWNVADQTIYHDEAHPSHMILPVIPH